MSNNNKKLIKEKFLIKGDGKRDSDYITIYRTEEDIKIEEDFKNKCIEEIIKFSMAYNSLFK